MRVATPPSADQVESTGLRLTFLTLLVVSLFVLLFARLWYLQIMAGERLEDQATGNAVRSVTLEAPRGQILDRNGEVIVRNRHAPVVSVQPDEMGDRQDAIYAELAEMLALDVEQIAERAESARLGPYRPRPIAVDVPEDVIAYIHENGSSRFPGVYAETLPLRDYPEEGVAAHLLGYLGEISEEELDSERYEGYEPGTLIGRTGIESIYEEHLRGVDGRRRLEVDAAGTVLRDLGNQLPVPGADVRLSINLEAQELTEEALREGIETARGVQDVEAGPGRGGLFRAPAGAAVVLDPNNGEVVAMASFPTFDPGSFVGGISQAELDRLLAEEAHYPLINRAIQSSYPPGSVFKVIPAAAALELGYMEPDSALHCPGSWEWNENTYRNWSPSDSGFMNLSQALVQSCDTIFYELARRMWLDEQNELEGAGGEGEADALAALSERLPDHARAWGLGQQTGIDLTSERAGVVPGREWKREYWENTRDITCLQAQTEPVGSYLQEVLADLCEYGYRWRGGDSVNMSIGQGDVQATPLQVANVFAAIANRGTLYEPRVAREIVEPDGEVIPVPSEVAGQLPVSREHIDYIHAGLVGVTQPSGTAGSVFGDFPVPLAGKTGTAEYKPKQPIAWFAGYAPADSPQYVVVAMVEEGGGGSQTAAPIVRRIFEGLFDLAETDIQPGEKTD